MAVLEFLAGHSEILLLVLVVRLPAPCADKVTTNRNNCSCREVKTCGMAPAMDRSNEHLVAAFAHVLREARQSAGLTQEDLAERAEVSVRFISMLETGRRQPSLSALAALAEGLRSPMSALVSAVEGRLSLQNETADNGEAAVLSDQSPTFGQS